MFMEKMHGAANSTAAKIILALVSIPFLLGGVASYVMHANDTSAAKVNGEEISQQLFQQQYGNEYQRLSRELGNQFALVADSPEFVNGLRTSVLNNLINQELLRQYVNQLRISATDKQIEREIISSPSFQRNGKFDNNLYQQSLAASRISADTYAGYVREALRLAQLQNGLLGSNFLVPAQQQELAKNLFQRRDVRLAQLSLAEELAKQELTAEEVQTYYNSHIKDFAVPEQVKVQYIDLSVANLEKNIKVTDEEIQQYYQGNKGQFASLHLAHIQLANLQEAQEVYQALQNGADFAELARTRSLDKPSAANGGDLDWIAGGVLPAAFESAAFALKDGEYSQPVQVDNAFHIIKLLASKVQPFDQVKEQIASKLRQEKVVNQFYSLEKLASEKAFENQDSLAMAAQAVGLQVQETALFTRHNVPAELNFPNVISNIFESNLTQGGVNSEAINVGDMHSILFRVQEHQAEGTTSLEEAKTKIEAFLKQQKAESAVLAQAEKLAQELTANANVATNLTFSAPQALVYAENQDPALNDVVFAMAKPQGNTPVYAAAKTKAGEVVVVQLDKVTDGELNEAQMQAFNTQVEQAQQQELQGLLIQSLRDKAKIEVNQEFMNQNQE